MGQVVAVVGATGLVGREMLRILQTRHFPADRVIPLASSRSAGCTVTYGHEQLPVAEATPESFTGVAIALFSAGKRASLQLAPEAAARGAVVIDNSSAWRMDPEVPLVVPEVNPAAAAERPKGIIANPNCSTIQMVVALAPIHQLSPLRHVVVSTYQAASGKGWAAVEELRQQRVALSQRQPLKSQVFPGPIADNVITDWPAGAADYSEEEHKMVNETRKILAAPDIGVSPTTVRVPVETGHAEAVHVQCRNPISAQDVKRVLVKAAGIKLIDEAYRPGSHPQPTDCVGNDWVYVGRVRDDLAVAGAVNLWIVADNLRKGAALNAVQIAEMLS